MCCFFLRPRLRCSRTRQKTHPHTERRCCLESFRAFHLYHSFIRSHKFRCFFARGRRYNPRRISFICLNLFLFRLRLRTLSFIHVRNVREQQRGHAENELTYPAAMLQAFFTRPSVYYERIILIPCFVNVLFFYKNSTGERHKMQHFLFRQFLFIARKIPKRVARRRCSLNTGTVKSKEITTRWKLVPKSHLALYCLVMRADGNAAQAQKMSSHKISSS